MPEAPPHNGSGLAIPYLPVYASSGLQADTEYLASPNVTPQGSTGAAGDAQVVAASVRGWRPTMEDFTVIKSDASHLYAAIFDGHNGRACAEHYAGDDGLYSVLREAKVGEATPGEAVTRLREAYEAVDADFVLGEPDDSFVGGTGAAFWLERSGALTCSWCGDTMAYLVRQNTVIPLTYEHTPTADDLGRVKAAGGVVTTAGYIKLAKEPEQIRMARCFGDKMLKAEADDVQEHIVLPHPDHTTVKICAHDQFMFMCSRPLLAVLSPDYIAEYVLRSLEYDKGAKGIQEALHALLESAVASKSPTERETLARGGYENMSVAVLIVEQSTAPSELSDLATTNPALLSLWREQQRLRTEGSLEKPAAAGPHDTEDDDDLVEDIIAIDCGAPAAPVVTVTPPAAPQQAFHLITEDVTRSAPPRSLSGSVGASTCQEATAGYDDEKNADMNTVWALHDGGREQVRSQVRLTGASGLLPCFVLGVVFLVQLCVHLARGDHSAGAVVGAGGLLLLGVAFMNVSPMTMKMKGFSGGGDVAVMVLCLGVLIPYDVLSGDASAWPLFLNAFALFALFPVRTAVLIPTAAVVLLWVTARVFDESTHFFNIDERLVVSCVHEPDKAQLAEKGREWLYQTLAMRCSSLVFMLCVALVVADLEGKFAMRLDALQRVIGGVLLVVMKTPDAPAVSDIISLALVVHPTSLLADAVESLVGVAEGGVAPLPAGPCVQSVLVRSQLLRKGESGSSRSPTAAEDNTEVEPPAELAEAGAAKTPGFRAQEVTILTVVLRKQWSVSLYAPLHKLVLAALDETPGSPPLFTYGGNTATLMWNLNDLHAGHEQLAVAYAVLLQQLNVSLPNPLAISMGIACGLVQVGEDEKSSMGTVIGQPTESSALLAAFARNVKCRVVITAAVFERNKFVITARPLDVVAMPGECSQVVYEMRSAHATQAKQLPGDASYDSAFAALQRLDLQEARDGFAKVLEASPTDAQARRLFVIARWLQQTRMHDSRSTTEYSRNLTSELEAYTVSAATEAEEVVRPSTSSSRTSGSSASVSGERGTNVAILHSSSARRGSLLTPPSPIALSSAGRMRRQSLKHDQILRRQIRDAEAEANSDQLVAWGLPGAGAATESRKDTSRLSSLPARFKDHKNNLWCRASRILGRGAFGEVWLGMGTNGSLVAIKSMKIPTFASASDAAANNLPAAARKRLARKQGNNAPILQGGKSMEHIDQLLREVGLMHTLRHENIVSYMASTVVDGYVMIVMEYLSGGSLNDLLSTFDRGSIPVTSIQLYVRDIVNGLRFLHSRDMIHRDMKPHNVLLLVDGQCKLADFGASAGLSQLAKSNQGVIGTPLYMAPEACFGKACKSSDVWAVGIMLCQLFTGVVPYAGFADTPDFNPHTFLYQLGHGEHLFPEIPHVIPSGARDIAKRCLMRKPDDRPTAEELRQYVQEDWTCA